MTSFVWILLAGVCAVVFRIGHLVKGVNDRFDQIEQQLDVLLDPLDK